MAPGVAAERCAAALAGLLTQAGMRHKAAAPAVPDAQVLPPPKRPRRAAKVRPLPDAPHFHWPGLRATRVRSLSPAQRSMGRPARRARRRPWKRRAQRLAHCLQAFRPAVQRWLQRRWLQQRWTPQCWVHSRPQPAPGQPRVAQPQPRDAPVKQQLQQCEAREPQPRPDALAAPTRQPAAPGSHAARPRASIPLTSQCWRAVLARDGPEHCCGRHRYGSAPGGPALLPQPQASSNVSSSRSRRPLPAHPE